jgi:hypothetical protein
MKNGRMKNEKLRVKEKYSKDPKDFMTGNLANLANFNTMFQRNRIGIQDATEQQPFSCDYIPAKIRDVYQDSSHFISDDINYFLEYYLENNFQEFNFAINQYNNMNQIIKLICDLKIKLIVPLI